MIDGYLRNVCMESELKVMKSDSPVHSLDTELDIQISTPLRIESKEVTESLVEQNTKQGSIAGDM